MQKSLNNYGIILSSYSIRIEAGLEAQSTYIHLECTVRQCLSFRWNWDPPPLPLPQASVLPPETKGGGTPSPAGEWVGESQFGRLVKKLSTLSTLWLEGTQLQHSCAWLQYVKLLISDYYNITEKNGSCVLKRGTASTSMPLGTLQQFV